MAGFLYFVSGAQRPDVEAQGLAYALPGSIAKAPVVGGPNGVPGLVMAQSSRHPDRKIGYYPAEQRWEKMPTAAGVPERWLGYWNDGKPTPADLEKPVLLDSKVAYALGGSEKWSIATLTELDEAGGGACALPGREVLADDGGFVSLPPEGEPGRLWELVHPVALRLLGFAEPPPTHAELRTATVALLAANYVVSTPELSLLGCLFNYDGPYETVVKAAVRGQWLLDAIAALEKKTGSPPPANTSHSSAGAGA